MKVSPQEMESLDRHWSTEMDDALRAEMFRYGAAWEKVAEYLPHPCSAEEAEKRYHYFVRVCECVFRLVLDLVSSSWEFGV